MSQGENSKHKAPKNGKKMLVRYGQMGGMGWFEHHEAHIPKLNSHVVIKTERGLELGQVVGVHNYRGGQFKSTPEQVEKYYSNRTKDYPLGAGGQFVRFATHEDIREQEHLEKSAIGEAKCCQKHADEMGLKMKIIEAEHLFGGERIIFYFTSEGRVDFRDLVKQLAREYQTRIELRQIGSRDEARLVSDFETCGQQCCCSRYLKILEPVNMRMAKLQKATLDPSKISGHCGRLKCCLRYEDQTYMELKDKLPKRNTTVQTPKGLGKVVDMHILTQLVVVQDQLGDRKAWPVDELCKPGEKPKKKPQSESDLAEDLLEPSMGRPGKTVADSAVTQEIEEMAQSEQQTPGDGEKKKRRRRRRKPRQDGPKGEGDRQPDNKQQGQDQKQDGQNSQQAQDQGGQQGDKKRPPNKNRRRRPRNKNRNGNAPKDGQGGNSADNQNRTNENQNNRPKPDKPNNQSNGNQPKQGGE